MGTKTSKQWSKWEKGSKWIWFIRLKEYNTDKEDLDHWKQYEHPVTPCKYGDRCFAFVRWQQSSWSIKD